jgi:hypothetical protein
MTELVEFESKVKFSGHVTVREYDAKTLKLLKEQRISNLVVKVFLQKVIDHLIAAATLNAFNYIGVGSGSTAPTENDTDLQTPILRKVCDERSRTDKTGYFTTWFGSDEGNDQTWTESGLFDSLAGGLMCSRALLAEPIVKTSLKVVQVEWRITSSAA